MSVLAYLLLSFNVRYSQAQHYVGVTSSGV